MFTIVFLFKIPNICCLPKTVRGFGEWGYKRIKSYDKIDIVGGTVLTCGSSSIIIFIQSLKEESVQDIWENCKVVACMNSLWNISSYICEYDAQAPISWIPRDSPRGCSMKAGFSSHSLFYPQCLEQCLAHSRSLVTFE